MGRRAFRKALDSLAQDLHQSWRALRHAPRFAIWIVASLAIGMGVTTAVFAFLNTLLFLPFPGVAGQERLVRVGITFRCGPPDCWEPAATAGDHDALEQGLSSLGAITTYALTDVAVALPAPRSVRAALVSDNHFEVLGVHPAIGRTFGRDDRTSSAPVAVVSHALWTRELGADPSAVGRAIRVADEWVTVVAVAPESFVGIDLKPARGDRGIDVWLPLWLADRVAGAGPPRPPLDRSFVGRLNPGATPAQVRAQALIVAARLAAARAAHAPGARVEVTPIGMTSPRNRSLTLAIIMPIPILVLVMACVNAANLMLARGLQRQGEMAIRLALGSGRGRIIRQQLFEAGMLAAAAAAVAIPPAWWLLRLAEGPLIVPVRIDARIVALTGLTALVTTVLFGLLPALRLSDQRPSALLGSAGASGGSSPFRSRARQALVLAQAALSIGVMATAWQLVATVRLQAVSGGVPPDQLLIARFDLAQVVPAPGDRERFLDELLARTARLPDVVAVGLAPPDAVWSFGRSSGSGDLTVWEPDADPGSSQRVMGGQAGARLFEAVGLRMLAGRGFTEEDRQRPPLVVVVNEAAARRLRGPALGSVLRVGPRRAEYSSSRDVRIVGVVESAREPRLEAGEAPRVYLPSALEPEAALAIYVRTRGRATALAPMFRDLVADVAPRVPIVELGSLEQVNERSYAPQLWLARAAATLGGVGLLLAAAGLYAVSSFLVGTRLREMAIRIAVGARPRTLLVMVAAQSMRLALAGLLIGTAAAAALSQVLQAGYHGIRRLDPGAFGGAAGVFLVTMLIASLVPAIRASRVDPIAYLKES